jgi:hypothetical protein
MFVLSGAAGAEPLDRAQAADALRRAVEFYHTKVAAHGGYVYRYSADLAKREGEGKTGPDTVWVQPPGTPAVGLALVEAYERTGERFLLDAARDAAECLVRGQLRSGGWTNSIEFEPDARRKFAYRVDPPRAKAFNVSTFDDDKTQSAMRFLIRFDQATKFKDERVHESITVALDSVLKAQHPNGAWAQGWDEFPDPKTDRSRPKRASYPSDWPREYPGGKYWFHYTFNDNTVADTIDMLLLAARTYDEPRYRAAALRAGDFILLAQMPDPQPAWAQQYDAEMHPVWARKFEPPAITGSESQGLISVLLRLYVETGDRKYIEPVPRAIEYLQQSQLADGKLARFYELGTNKPLYFTRKYELTYDDGDLPTHYGFKVSSRLDALVREHQRLDRLTPDQLKAERSPRPRPDKPASLESQVRALIELLDRRGAWVEDGRLSYHGKDDDTRQIIDSRTFIRNVGILSRYLAATKG